MGLQPRVWLRVLRSEPWPIRIARVIAVLQLGALLVGAVAAALYVHKSGVHRSSSEDAQYAQIGYALACGLALLCVVLVAVGLRRLGTGPGRGRLVLNIGEGDVAIGAYVVGNAIDSYTGPSPIATVLLAALSLSGVVTVGLLLLPPARAWIADPR